MSRKRTASSHYLWLFGLQTVGVAILLLNGIPLYREIAADPSSHVGRPETLIWALTSIALMQVGYWLCYRTPPPMPRVSHPLLGHIVQFVSRMSFVFATSIFGFAFITKESGFSIPGFRSIVAIAALFSLFCYTRELERVGKIVEWAFPSDERIAGTRKAA